VKENRGIDYLIDWTERFVADQKINTFYVDLAANVRYQRRPEFNGTEKIYTLADLRRFGDFCRDHFSFRRDSCFRASRNRRVGQASSGALVD
jgi:hypothetical protein